MPKVDKFKRSADILMHLVDIKQKNFVLDLWYALVDASPVQSGKMRSSWFATPYKAVSKEIPDGTYGYPAEPAIYGYKKFPTKWFVVNTAPYTAKVNYATAKQVPTLFIENARNRILARYG